MATNIYLNMDKLIGVPMPTKAVDLDKDKKVDYLKEDKADRALEKEPKVRFNEKDIEQFKSFIKDLYKADLDGFAGIINSYYKDFRPPELYFDFDSSYKTGFKLIDESKINSVVLAAYDRGLNKIIIKRELLDLYKKGEDNVDSIDHALAHELGHSIAMQSDITKNGVYNSKKSIYGTVTDELLANLFAAELMIVKQGLPISNESVARQLIKDNVDIEFFSKDIDAAKIYLKELDNYSTNVVPSIKRISDTVHAKIIDFSNRGLKSLNYETVVKINNVYFDEVKKQLNDYLINALANYSIHVYSAPLLGASRALLSKRMSVGQLINAVSDDISSVKEIRRYLKGSFASVNLKMLSAIESDLIEITSEQPVIEAVNDQDKISNYAEVFLKVADRVEDEFKNMNRHLEMEIESEKRLLKDFSKFKRKFDRGTK